eukprot:scaffold36942_cov50-Phaeocystis_antarctica.AAC.2
MYRSSCSTISFGRSAFSSATSAVSSSDTAAAGSSMVTFTSGCAAALWHMRTRWRARGEGRSPLAMTRLDRVDSMLPANSIKIVSAFFDRDNRPPAVL